MVLEKTLEGPLDSKEINPEGLMLKLKLQYSGHLMRRANSLEMTLMLGKMEGKRRRRQQRMRYLDSVTNSVDVSLSKLPPGDSQRQEKTDVLQSRGSQKVRQDLATE